MINTVLFALVGGVLLFAVVFLAIAEGRRRGRAEVEAETAEAGLKAREAMDDATREKVGRRWALIEWARARLSSSK